MQFGESAVVETGVKMSIEITRIVLIPDENEILRGEELAVAGNQDSAVGPRWAGSAGEFLQQEALCLGFNFLVNDAHGLVVWQAVVAELLVTRFIDA